MKQSSRTAEALSAVIDRERESRGLSIRSLSEQAAIPLPTLARRLHINSRSPFTADEIERIAAVFGVRPSDLFVAAESSAA